MYLRKPTAGRHSKEYAMSMLLVLRDVLHLVCDKREAKMVLGRGDVLVDGVVVKDDGFPLGLMDVIAIPKAAAYYRVVLNEGKLKLVSIKAEETKVKLCKISDKRLVRGGRIQLCMHDGRTHIMEREEDRFKVGDTVKLSIPKQQLQGALKLEKNARCYVYKGRHSGEVGVLEEIKVRPGSKASDAFLKATSGTVITRKDYLFVVPEEFKV